VKTTILFLLVATLTLSATASANWECRNPKFPFLIGSLCWSKTLSSPNGLGFTHGCVALNNKKQAILDARTRMPKLDQEMCTRDDDDEVVVADSEAASACNEVGGRLPTRREFIVNWILNYSHISGGNGTGIIYLTPAGIQDLSRHLREDISTREFWSSSSASTFPDKALLFGGDRLKGADRTTRHAVRCVAPARFVKGKEDLSNVCVSLKEMRSYQETLKGDRKITGDKLIGKLMRTAAKTGSKAELSDGVSDEYGNTIKYDPNSSPDNRRKIVCGTLAKELKDSQ